MSGTVQVRHLLEQLPRQRLLGLDLVDASPSEVAAALAGRPVPAEFSYIVIPNADHLVRLGGHREELAPLYHDAGALLLDSRVVRRIARLLGLPAISVVTGSDLTALLSIAHFALPFGFEADEAMVEQCARFIEAHASRFVFLACGAPRQELLAHRVAQRGKATGIGLCIGAAIDQIGGLQPRAPAWMRRAGLERGWRILSEPGRLGLRYPKDLAIMTALLAERRKSRIRDRA